MKKIFLSSLMAITSMVGFGLSSCDSDNDPIINDNSDTRAVYDDYYKWNDPMNKEGEPEDYYVKYIDGMSLIRFAPEDSASVIMSIKQKGLTILDNTLCNYLIIYRALGRLPGGKELPRKEYNGSPIYYAHNSVLAVVNANRDEVKDIEGVYYSSQAVVLSEDNKKYTQNKSDDDLYFTVGAVSLYFRDSIVVDMPGYYDPVLMHGHLTYETYAFLSGYHEVIEGNIYDVCRELRERKNIIVANPVHLSLAYLKQSNKKQKN